MQSESEQSGRRKEIAADSLSSLAVTEEGGRESVREAAVITALNSGSSVRQSVCPNLPTRKLNRLHGENGGEER